MRPNQAETKPAPECPVGIVVPPGCDSALLRESGEPVYTYTPPSYRPWLPPEETAGTPCVPRQSGAVPVPQTQYAAAPQSMTEYLRQFLGAYLCLELWSGDRMKAKKCGVLTEIGRNFLALRERGGLSLVELKSIRCIHIFCR